jgi:undecaprenyl-diphosphatase
LAVTAVDGGVVLTEEGDRTRIERHPSDLLRLIVSILATLVGFYLATGLNNLSHVLSIEVIEGFDSFPNWLIIIFAIGLALVALLLPFIIIGYLVWKRMWRHLLVGLAAVVLALVTLWAVDSFLVQRFSPSDLEFTPPSWICEPGILDSEVGVLTCISLERVDDPLERFGLVVAMTAFFAVLYPYLNRVWRRFAWAGLVLYAMFEMLITLDPPTDQFLAIGIAFSIGTGMLLLFGMPDRRPKVGNVADALKRFGIELAHLDHAKVDARGSVPFIAKTTDGVGLFIKVLTPEEKAADTLFRRFRMFRLKGVGDERPFNSLRREVEHEAVMSLKAASDGVRTPRLVAVVDIEPSSMLLAYEQIDGKSLDSVPAGKVTDDVLVDIWELIRELRVRRTAHRDLRWANVFLAVDGKPWLIDFGFSELAATDGQLRSDVAELLTSSATVVGPERAVRCAVTGIGAEAVASAASRIQPLALSGATRTALKKQKMLAPGLRFQIAEQTGMEVPELENLERIRPKTVLMVLGFALALYLLIPQLTQTDFSAVFGANWAQAPAILIASFLTYVGAGLNIMGSVPDKVRLVPSVLVQFAGSFINRISPVKVGGMATNVRYLRQSGIDLTSALAGLGVSNVATFLTHMTLLLITVFALGRNPGDFISLPSGSTVLLGVVALLSLATIGFLLPVSRKMFQAKALPAVRKTGEGLAQIAHTPSKAIMLFGGAFLMIVSYIAALWFSVEAFGGGLSIAAVALAFLGGQALGNLAPTPGGIGGAEAALIVSMTALGLDATTAVAATFLYRTATFWLPILPGVLSFRKLQREHCL